MPVPLLTCSWSVPLPLQVWEYHPWGAHVLLGDHSISLSALVHSAAGWPAQRIARNVAPIKRGRSGNVGSVTFTAGALGISAPAVGKGIALHGFVAMGG